MGRDVPDSLPGKSLQGVMRGSNRRENVYIEWSPGDTKVGPVAGASERDIQRAVKAHTRTVITQDGWKLCLSDADRHQLFNLEQDPWELHNLFHAGGHDDVVRRLANDIHRWQKEVNDTVVVDPAVQPVGD
jgi:arylsulfatase A-like enzyme